MIQCIETYKLTFSAVSQDNKQILFPSIISFVNHHFVLVYKKHLTD